MEKRCHLIRAGRLEGKNRRLAAKPTQDFGGVLVAVAENEAFSQRPLGGERPFLPDLFQFARSGWPLAQASRQPEADGGRLLDLMDQVVGVIGADFPPEAFVLARLGPFVLLWPVARGDEYIRGAGRIEWRWLRRSLLVIVARLLEDVGALGADFPARIALGHVDAARLGRGAPVPARMPDPFVGWKPKLDRRAVGGSNQMG